MSATLIPVSYERHANVRWQRYTSYAFASSSNVVPLVVSEIARAALALPTAFIRHEDTFVFVAVLGLTPGRNLFVGENGRWLGGYVPAAFRAYPFALGRQEDGQTILCFNEASGLVGDNPDGVPFFDEEGKPSEPIRQVMEFLNLVEQSRQATSQICSELARRDVLRPWQIVLKTPNGDQILDGLFRVDEERLHSLDDEGFLALRKVGALPLVYAQLLSMQHLQMLGGLAEASARKNQPAQASDLSRVFEPPSDTLVFDWDKLES